MKHLAIMLIACLVSQSKTFAADIAALLPQLTSREQTLAFMLRDAELSFEVKTIADEHIFVVPFKSENGCVTVSMLTPCDSSIPNEEFTATFPVGPIKGDLSDDQINYLFEDTSNLLVGYWHTSEDKRHGTVTIMLSCVCSLDESSETILSMLSYMAERASRLKEELGE